MARLFAAVPILVALVGCGAADPNGLSPSAHDNDDEEPSAATVGTTREALSATDSVATAVLESCTTTAVKGLATQLVDEIQCLRPGTMAKIDQVTGLKLGAAVFPYLQAPAATALSAAQKARGVTMTINSGLRTLPQQYLLYRWYQTGRCGIGLAASPGKSNHESAIAVDIEDNAGWRSAMQGKSFRWLGASDPVHYDFIGGGAVDLRGLSVKAFQRLWNRNHPEDVIPEDSAYGAETEKRLARSPSGGFAKGANCNDPNSTPPSPAQPAPTDLPSTPDATEPGTSESSTSDSSASATSAEAEAESRATRTSSGGASGCSITDVGPLSLGSRHDADITGALGVLAIGCTLLRRRQRGRVTATSPATMTTTKTKTTAY